MAHDAPGSANRVPVILLLAPQRLRYPQDDNAPVPKLLVRYIPTCSSFSLHKTESPLTTAANNLPSKPTLDSP